MDIVMTGYAGQKETAVLAERFEDRLRREFPLPVIEAAKKLASDYEPPEECMSKAHVRITAGGVAAALWILGEKLQSGLNVDLRSIPIRQETVEICEILDLDPYSLRSDGAWLIAVADAEQALLLCRIRNIPAAKIGETTGGDARVLACGEVTRYLERA